MAGDVVEVPFGNRKVVGVVVDDNVKTDIDLKMVSSYLGINIGKDYCDFLNWVASYTFIPKGLVLKMILAEKAIFTKRGEIFPLNTQSKCEQVSTPSVKPIVLSPEQHVVFQSIMECQQKPFLLHGVTGSGKTETYLKVAQEIFSNDKQVLVLLPEIALTNQLLDKIEQYFSFRPLVWNSNISPKNKRIAWQTAISGDRCIVIGARSALFLPFKNLGLIVVDEEHDTSYKQEEGGFYNARDMAVVLAHLKKIPVILSSATPSLESYVNAQNGKYGYVQLKNRFGAANVPPIQLIDMRQCNFDGFISPNLLNAIKKTIAKGEQCLIYLNRRGYAPVTLCQSCGDKISCPNCTSWLVYHKNIDKIVCHYCGHTAKIPKKCKTCGTEDSYILFGPGIERIFEELSAKIPNGKTVVVSSDTFSSEKNISELLEKIHNNDVNIIIGTQILAKGHHFPNITLVGIVDGDLGLYGADLRASEKTYQLISQVAGRAGRAEKPGKIMIQTFNPDHSLYTSLKSNKFQHFIDQEISSRRDNDLPPFTKFAAIIISGINKDITEKVAKKLASTCPKHGITMFGPAPAPFFLLRGRSRWRILLRISKKIATNESIKQWIDSQNAPKNVKIYIDVDPINFF
jgi:primosomal protein N' (replication factor Y)